MRLPSPWLRGIVLSWLCLALALGQGNQNAQWLANVHCRDNDTAGELDEHGHNCSWYESKPHFVCGWFDNANFKAKELCCFCQPRQFKPKPPDGCMNTNNYIVDDLGFDCDLYREMPDYCGFLDTKDFHAYEMCCHCMRNETSHGGRVGEICPFFSLSALPDERGLCRCGAGASCYQGSAAGKGCPAASGSSEDSFDVGCRDCYCTFVRDLEKGPLRDYHCESTFAETGLEDETESWMVFVVFKQVREQLYVVLNALLSARTGWKGSTFQVQLTQEAILARQRSLLRQWANIFFKSISSTNFAVSSCGIAFKSGSYAALTSGGCWNPNQQYFLTSLTGDKLEAYKVKGAACHYNKVLDLRSCNTDTLWLEGSSGRQVPVVHNGTNGNFAYGPAHYNPQLEGWRKDFDTGDLEMTQGMVYLGPYVSHVHRQMVIGFGLWLLNRPTKTYDAMLKCELTSDYLNGVLMGLVGAGARLFMQSHDGTVMASTHGETSLPDPDGIVPRPVFFWNSSDEVVKQVGGYLNESLSGKKFKKLMPNMSHEDSSWNIQRFTEKWKEMNLTLRMWVLVEKIPLWTVYVDAPQCRPGMEMVAPSVNHVTPCTVCPKGRKSEFGERVGERCSNCTPGSYSAFPGSTICFTCSSGQYQDESGASRCKACPNNTTSPPGADDIEKCRCEVAHYSLSKQQTVIRGCQECPFGSTCDGGDGLPLANSAHFSLIPGVAVKCVSTMADTPCLGGRWSAAASLDPFPGKAVNYCKEGYEGVACSYCAQGFYRFGRDCLSCDDTPKSLLLLYWVLLIILFYLLRRVVNSRYKSLYIFLSFLQVFGLQGSFPLRWPSEIKHFMRVVQMFNLQVDLLMPHCDSERHFPFFYKFIMYLCLPWFFLVVDLTLMFLHKLFKAIRSGIPHSAEGERMKFAPKLSEVTGLRDQASGEVFRDFLAQALVNMRLMFLSLCGKTLDMVQCTKLDTGNGTGEWRLSRDMNYKCWEDAHAAYLPLVIFSAVVYVLGTPLAYTYILCQGYRSNLLYSKEHLRRYGVLYSRFEPGHFYWEMVIILRRFLAVAVKVMLNIRTAIEQQDGYFGNYQAALLAFVTVLALASHFYARPFCNPYLDFGDAVYQGSIFTSCLIGLCFSSSKSTAEERFFMRCFYVLCSCVVIVTLFLLWRDLEVEHPRVRTFRVWALMRLGVTPARERARARIEQHLRGRHSSTFQEVVEGINYERLAYDQPLLDTLEALVTNALLDCLAKHDIYLSKGDVRVSLTQAAEGGDRVLCTSVVAPPKGIATSSVEQVLENHSQHNLLHGLLAGLGDACGLRAALRDRVEDSQLVTQADYSVLQQNGLVLGDLKAALRHAITERLDLEELHVPSTCVDVVLESGSQRGSLLVRSIIAPPPGIELDRAKEALRRNAHRDHVARLARGLCATFGSSTHSSI